MATRNNLDIFSRGFTDVLQEQWRVDVQLKGGDSDEGESISAHKLVLAARSKVFRKILEEEDYKASSKMEVITLPEMKHEEVKALVEFMYSDGSMPCKVHARSLYLAAERYEIPHLREVCRNELISSLSISNALDVFELAQIPLDSELKKAALDCVKTNIVTIVKSDEFKRFVASNPNLTVEILTSNSYRSPSNNGFAYCLNCRRW